MEWISVEDDLPLKGENILMYYDDLVVEGEYQNGNFYHVSSCAHFKGYCKCEAQKGITHWMPLPNPPEIPDN